MLVGMDCRVSLVPLADMGIQARLPDVEVFSHLTKMPNLPVPCGARAMRRQADSTEGSRPAFELCRLLQLQGFPPVSANCGRYWFFFDPASRRQSVAFIGIPKLRDWNMANTKQRAGDLELDLRQSGSGCTAA